MPSPLASALAFAPQFPGQPIAPQVGSPPTNKVAVSPTDVTGAYKLSTDAAMQQYLAKLQQQNAMWGGLAGIGGAGIVGGPAWLKMFGNGANAASGGAAATTPAAVLDPAVASAGGIGSDYAASAGAGSVADALAGTAGATGLDASLGTGATVAGTLGADAAASAAADAGATAGGGALADFLASLPLMFLGA
jgi:hypothetical protein